jgi:hypothetical protein
VTTTFRRTRCIDCLAENSASTRAAPKPGPRCIEHWRTRKKAVSKANHANRIEDVFGITGEEYWAIYESQNGRCFICEKATGARKRLAVDHDHNLCGDKHDPNVGCRNCIRALLCGPCNKMIGYLDVPALKRAIEVLEKRPAQKVLLSLQAQKRTRSKKAAAHGD